MLISIYMPTKNRLDLLTKAVDSVRAQTLDNWELIVVDDGSTDGTKDYLERLSKADARIRYLSNPTSKGGPTSRNAAISLAQGDFVTGLDDDDSFTSDRLQRFAEVWADLKAKGLSPSALYSEQNIYQHGVLIDKTRKLPKATYEQLFTHNHIGNQIFAPRKHFLSAGLFRPELPAWQDLEFFMRVLKQYGTAYLAPHATYNFDESPRPDRVSLKSEEKMRNAFEIVNRLHCEGDARKTQNLLLQLLGRYYRLQPRMSDYRRFLSPEPWPLGISKLFMKSIQMTPLYARASEIKKALRSS